MLIEFSTSNFRSFSLEQTLSMEAVCDKLGKEKPGNKFETKVTWKGKKSKEIDLLKSAIIYGANNSGKTNFIKSIITLKNLVLNSFQSPLSENTQLERFLLDKNTKNKPSNFKIIFIKDKTKYSYSISTDFKQIISEKLTSYENGSSKIIFSRSKENISLKIDGKKQHIISSTKIGSLLLSTAIGLNTDNIDIRNTYDFFTQDLLIDSGNASFDFRTKSMILKENNTQIIEIFKKAIGSGVIDIELTKKDLFQGQKNINLSFQKDGSFQIVDENQLPQKIKEENMKKMELDQYKVDLIRQSNQGERISFELNQHESRGTQKLFHYIGPIIDSLNKGKVFILDELDNTMHPKLMKFIIELFHSKEYNKKNAQLILTSHDSSLIGKQLDIFRRDQIWFIDKSDYQYSMLYPLTDYYTRKESDFADLYLAGRYGAILEN